MSSDPSDPYGRLSIFATGLDATTRALHAVLDLHKPTSHLCSCGEKHADYCEHCEYTEYPCPTVAAIRKELGS